MTRVVWVVMAFLILAIGVPAAVIKQSKDKGTAPHQEISRAVLVPTDVARRVIVPPCGTGVPVASIPPGELADTPGTISFTLRRGRGDRVLLIPRCRASQGAQASEGANLPSAAFVLPVGADVTAGRGGSAEAGTEIVQAQIVVPANSSIETVVVPQCIEGREEATRTATGRAIILEPLRDRPRTALAPPC